MFQRVVWNRRFNIKKAVSLLLVFCILLSVVNMALVFVKAGSVSQKTMLKMGEDENGFKTFPLDTSVLKADTEYTVSYKYHLAAEGAEIVKNLYLVLREYNAGNYNAVVETHYDNNKVTTVYGNNTVTHKFKLTAEEISKNLHIGFWSSANKLVYIADLVMYETADSDKKNVLPKDEYCADTSDFVSRWGIKPNVSYVPYDESLFIKKDKTMLKFGEDENGFKTFPLDTSVLKADTEYTVSYKYHFADENSEIVKNLYMVVSEYNAGNYNAVIETHYDNSKVTTLYGNKTVVHTFKFTAEEIEKKLHIGFWSTANKLVYIADLVMYETADTDKKNILPKDEYCTNTSDFVSRWGITPNVSYVPYDENFFIKKDKMMLKMGKDENGFKTFPLDTSVLKADTEYTVSYKYHLAAEGAVIVSNLYMVLSEYNAGNYTAVVETHYDNNKVTTAYGNNTVTHKFKLTAEDISKNLHIGFWSSANKLVYIADFVMYESEDENKKNVLPKDEYCTNTSDFVSRWGIKPTVSYIPYDENLFISREKTMLKMGEDENGYKTFPLNTAVLKADTEYTVSYKYSFAEAGCEIVKNLYLVVEEYAKGDYSHIIETHYDNSKVTTVYGNKIVTHKFKLTEEEISKNLHIGFWSSANKLVYIADFVMYESEDENKKNILPKDEYCTNISDFVSRWGMKPSVSYVPYVESLFESKEKTMLKIDDTENGYKTFPLNTSILKADTEYTVSFKYCFPDNNGRIITNLYMLLSAYNAGEYSAVIETHFDNSKVVSEYDGLTVTHKFKLTPSDISKNLHIGFWSSIGKEVYISDFVMYESADAEKKNVLPKDEYCTNTSDFISRWGIKPSVSYVPYDAEMFVYVPVEMMFHVKDLFGFSFVATPLEDGILKADTEYTVTFKYHYNSLDLDNDTSFAIFYTGENPTGGRVIDKFLRVSNNKPGMILSTNFDSKFKDGVNAKYTFTLSADDIEKSKQIFVGFNINQNEDPADFYVYDLKLYETKDTAKTNLLKMDTYTWDINRWYGLFGKSWQLENREYIPYDSSLFPETDGENQYIIIKEFTGDDGEWWKPSDVANTKVEVATLKGRVTDQNGNGISDARLILKGINKNYEVKTDVSGYYVFRNVLIDFYELYIIDGYDREINTGFFNTLQNGDTATVNIRCDSSKATFPEIEIISGNLKGTVYTPELKTVSNIKLYLSNCGEIVTDSKGVFEFIDVPVGNYEIYTVLENGEKYIFRTVEIKENVELAVKLKYDVPKAENDGMGAYVIWIIISASAVLVVIGTVTTVLIIKRKKQVKV